MTKYSLDTRALSAFSTEPISWLWEPYLARGWLAVLDGDPGVGKSLLALDLAARLSRGRTLPDGKPLDRPHVTLFLSAEDGVADTLRPRAEAAGADLTKLVVAGLGLGPLPRFPDDLPTLEDLVREHRVDLVVLDPFAAFVPPGPPGTGDRPTRRTLNLLASLAARRRCAVVLVRHLTKFGGLRWLYRGLGSLGVVPAVRTGLLLARHPRDPVLRVLARSKPRYDPPAPTLAVRPLLGPSYQCRLDWLGPVGLHADDLISTRGQDGQWPRERALAWLRRALADGPRRAADLIAGAASVGITGRTLKRAKKDLGVSSRRIDREGVTAWTWIGSDQGNET